MLPFLKLIAYNIYIYIFHIIYHIYAYGHRYSYIQNVYIHVARMCLYLVNSTWLIQVCPFRRLIPCFKSHYLPKAFYLDMRTCELSPILNETTILNGTSSGDFIAIVLYTQAYNVNLMSLIFYHM